MDMASKYSGPAFPLKRQLRNGSPEHLLEIMHRNLAGDLRNDFEKRVGEIKAKGSSGILGPVGVQQALRELRAEYEQVIPTKSWGGGYSFDEFLGRVNKRVGELQSKLTARRELPQATPQHVLMRRELQAD